MGKLSRIDRKQTNGEKTCAKLSEAQKLILYMLFRKG